MQVITVFVCVIIITIGIGSRAAARRKTLDQESLDILRPNYGVAFEHIGKIRTSSNYWYHTFVMSLPEDTYRQTASNFTPHTLDPALRSRKLAQIVQNHQEALDSRIRELKHYAQLMLPQLPARPKRVKRSAPFVFIGGLSKSLFGTATYHDVEKIANMVNRLATSNVKLSEELKLSTKNLESYMKVNNKNNRELATMVRYNHNQLDILEMDYQKLGTMMMQKMNWLEDSIAHLMDTQRNVNLLLKSMDDISYGINRLSRGILPDSIVGVQDLHNAFKEINKFKHEVGHHFHFIDTNPLNYYKQADLKAYVNGSDIWIIMRLPIGLQKPMNLYRLHSWEMPVYKGSKHGTMIKDLSEFVSINDRLNSYSTISAEDYYRCKGEEVKDCPFSQTVLEMDPTRCLDNIIRDNTENIHKACSIEAISNILKPGIFAITNTRAF